MFRLFGVTALTVAASSLAACNFLEQLSGTPQCDALEIRAYRSAYAVGDTVTLTAGLGDKTGLPSNCLGSVSAEWSSSNSGVIEVSPTGAMRAVSIGRAVISARSGK